MPWRRRHFIKSAINAVTDFEFVFERLEVNIARSILDRLKQDEVHKADDRSGVCLRFNGGRIDIISADLEQFAGITKLLEDLLHAGGLAAVIMLNPFLDLFRWG